MTTFPFDRLVFTPFMVDLAQSPLRGHFDAETYVLGAFNPGMTVLPNGNLLFMVRIAEALRQPIRDGKVHAIRWHEGGYVLDGWPLELADTSDPRKFLLHAVEMTTDGLDLVAIHYDKAIAPQGSYQCYGVEDARISRMGEDAWLMTTCSVSPERHSTTLYSSHNGLDWIFEGLVLDHQNKDMLIFEGLIWATSTTPTLRAANGGPAHRSISPPHPTAATANPVSSPASALTAAPSPRPGSAEERSRSSPGSPDRKAG